MLNSLPKPSWIQNSQELCPCGSGQKYRQCCKRNLTIKDKGSEFFWKQDFAMAELAFRASLTQYSGFILSHTIYLLNSGIPCAELIEVDINAIEEVADLLAWALFKQAKTYSILPLFEHVKKLLPLPGMKERMIYLECLWLASGMKREEEACKRLARFRDFREIHDLRLLQVYLQLTEMSPIDELALLERILEKVQKPAERVQYGTLKAMIMEICGDTEVAFRFHEEILSKTLGDIEGDDIYSSCTLARAHLFRWRHTRDPSDLNKALECMNGIELAELNEEGKVCVLQETGRLHLLATDYTRAIDCFTRGSDIGLANNIKEGILSLIYRIEAYVKIGELVKAHADYELLEGLNIPQSYQLECLTCAGVLAVERHDKKVAKIILEKAKRLELAWPHFSKQRSELCVRLLEYIASDDDTHGQDQPNMLFRILGSIRSMSEFLELKPNFMGIGLNFNKMLETKRGPSGVLPKK